MCKSYKVTFINKKSLNKVKENKSWTQINYYGILSLFKIVSKYSVFERFQDAVHTKIIIQNIVKTKKVTEGGLYFGNDNSLYKYPKVQML